MTVKELIEKLQRMPQDAKVFVYCNISEDDDYAYDVKSYTKEDIRFSDYDAEKRWGKLDYYCQGDCMAGLYLTGRLDENPTETVVVIQ